MKDNLTAIGVVIDESGSMAHLMTDTLGGFNKFLAEQKAVPGDALFTLCTFGSDYRLVHNHVPLNTVPDLCDKTYHPRGNTALLDAIGTTINTLGEKLSAMPEEERPSKVLFVIITDGEENASRRFTKDQISSMIAHQKEKYNWEFVFFGASLDQVSNAVTLGVASANSMSYTASGAGVKNLYKSASRIATRYRSK